jgi:hypothetical protein
MHNGNTEDKAQGRKRALRARIAEQVAGAMDLPYIGARDRERFEMVLLWGVIDSLVDEVAASSTDEA